MTLDDFRRSLAAAQPPAGLDPSLRALWWDAKGDWPKAHGCAQEDEATTARVHAYLHRKEGDQNNAGHWYRKAGAKPAIGPLAEEWTALATAMLRGAP
jgi:hypothetical protein